MSEPEPPIGPVRCAHHRFVRGAAPQIYADCPRGLARVDSPRHVRHPLHPASSDSGLSPHTPGPMSNSKRRLTYAPAAADDPQLPRQPNPLAGLCSWGSVRSMQAPSTTNPPITSADDRLQRQEWAAWYLNVKPSWVYEAVRTGRLPCHRVGRHIRFTRTMLDAWIAEQPRQ
jgi:excisionase family DNA binding protein